MASNISTKTFSGFPSQDFFKLKILSLSPQGFIIGTMTRAQESELGIFDFVYIQLCGYFDPVVGVKLCLLL